MVFVMLVDGMESSHPDKTYNQKRSSRHCQAERECACGPWAALGSVSSSAGQTFPRDAVRLLGLRCSGAELLSLQAARQKCQRFAAPSRSMASQARTLVHTHHLPFSLHAVLFPSSAFLIS